MLLLLLLLLNVGIDDDPAATALVRHGCQ